jgi:hypothetical protein
LNSQKVVLEKLRSPREFLHHEAALWYIEAGSLRLALEFERSDEFAEAVLG